VADGAGTSDHDTHDLERLVAFADGELTGPDLAAAEAQVAACTECASLAEDLRSLRAADRALATPTRPRDFRLTPADAARLVAVAEPVTDPARLGEEMTVTTPAHRDHDPMLVAAAADTLEPADRQRVDGWLATCSACAELRRDLVALAEATRTMPTPARVRDYRLTPEQAERLRHGGWRGVLARIGSSRDTLTRPLAYGLTAIGLAGLLLSSSGSLLPFGSGASEQILSTVGSSVGAEKATGAGSAAGAADGGAVFTGQAESPTSDIAGGAAAPAASAAASIAAAPAPDAAVPSEAPASGAPAFLASAGPEVATGPNTGAAPATASDTGREVGSGATGALTQEGGASTGPSPVVLVSFGLLIAGVALFGLRAIARRRPSS